MDATKRQITKIAREVNKFTARMLKLDGIGTAEYDFIHVVRKNPGITQAAIREILALDKGAAARRAANLEAKGYLIRKANPADGRSQLLYATEKADQLKNSKALNCTPKVRQYDILKNDWGVFLCQKEYQISGTHRSLRSW